MSIQQDLAGSTSVSMVVAEHDDYLHASLFCGNYVYGWR